MLEFRELAKLKSTYVDSLPLEVNPLTGRVHTSFNQTGSVTGRLASSDPNLQNIPTRTDLGRRVRQSFIAAEGKLLLPFGEPESASTSAGTLNLLAAVCVDCDHVGAFKKFAAPGFVIEELIIISNQLGADKVSVFGLGHKEQP